MDPEKKSLNFIFPTKYVIPKSLKFGHWPSKLKGKWLKQIAIPGLWKNFRLQNSLLPRHDFPAKYLGLGCRISTVFVPPEKKKHLQENHHGKHDYAFLVSPNFSGT